MGRVSKPIYNFGAGPACLPIEVLNQIRTDIPDWYEGMSVMEISHRLPVFMDLAQSIEQDLRTLLKIPDEFAVLFMPDGARSQFSAVPLNLLKGATTANYLITGYWSELAFIEAKKYCQPQANDKNAAYLHYTDNETIQGIEFHQIPHSDGQWLVSDMTSNILTKPIDFKPYGLIYASAQKNLGIAGMTVVIVRKSLIGHAHPLTPSMLDYDVFFKSNSLYNTPPVFCWYVLGLILKWAMKQGNIETLAFLCQQKSNLLYNVIDNSNFYKNTVPKEQRSRVNIPFDLPTDKLVSLFLQEASDIGLKQLKGHKLAGGCRASIYNAMPIEGVKVLAEFMKTFEKNYA